MYRGTILFSTPGNEGLLSLAVSGVVSLIVQVTQYISFVQSQPCHTFDCAKVHMNKSQVRFEMLTEMLENCKTHRSILISARLLLSLARAGALRQIAIAEARL